MDRTKKADWKQKIRALNKGTLGKGLEENEPDDDRTCKNGEILKDQMECLQKKYSFN